MALVLDRHREVPRAPSWLLKGLPWSGPLLLTLVLGVETTRADSVTWTGAITDTSTGNSGTVVQSFNLNYTPITTTATSVTEAVAGSGNTTSTLPALSIPVDLMLKKMVINSLLNPIPNPPVPSPPIFASLTKETYNDPFTASSPFFTFNGTYSRTPSTVAGNYSASIDEAAIADLTGSFSYQGSLTPGSPGNATTHSTVTAALVGGGSLTFDLQSTLEFNPSIHLVGPEISFGSETIIVNPDSSFSFTGITTVQLVPEPSAFGLLGAGLLGVLGYCWRCRVRATRF
jgi:PEP-CTERM motif